MWIELGSLDMAVRLLDYLPVHWAYAQGIAFDSEVPKKQNLYGQSRK
jgi:hypothetical protein